MINLQDLIEEEVERRSKKYEDLLLASAEYKDNIIKGINVERNLRWLEGNAIQSYQAYNEMKDKKWQVDLGADFRLYQTMKRTLKADLNATGEDGVIIVPAFSCSLNFIVKMIAAYFGLKSGIFGFDSSFTTHEAYTPTGRLIHIGLDDDSNNYVKIDFHFKEKRND